MKRKRYVIVLSIIIAAAGVIFASRMKQRNSFSYIPKDLNDSHAQLMRILPPVELDRIRAMTNETEMGIYHRNLGMNIRNEWGLWKHSRLAKYFTNLGVSHADNMSAIILETLWCRIHNQPFQLNKRVDSCKAYEKAWAAPNTMKSPLGSLIEYRQIYGDEDSNGNPRAIHIGYSETDGAFWLYEWDKGVYAPTGNVLERIQSDVHWKNYFLEKQVRPLLDQVTIPVMSFKMAKINEAIEFLNRGVGSHVGITFESESANTNNIFTCNLKEIKGYIALLYVADCCNLSWRYETNRIVFTDNE